MNDTAHVEPDPVEPNIPGGDERGGGGEVTALSGRGQEFRPNALMEKVLSLAIENPGASKIRLAELAGCQTSTVYRWWQSPAFRKWWGSCVAAVTKDAIPDMLMELQRLVYSDDVAPGVKAKLVETIVKAVPATDSKDSVGSALLEILHRWNPSTYRASIKANTDKVKVQVDAVMGAERVKNATTTEDPGLAAAVGVVRANMQKGMVRVLEGEDVDPRRGGHSYGGEHPLPSLKPRGEGGAKSQREPEQPDEPRPYPPRKPHVMRNGRCTQCGDAAGSERKTCPRIGSPPDRGIYRIQRRDQERQAPPSD